MVLELGTLAPRGGTAMGKGHKVEERLVTFCFLTWLCGYMAVTPLWKCTEHTFMNYALWGASMLHFNKIYLRRQNSLLHKDSKSRLRFGQTLLVLPVLWERTLKAREEDLGSSQSIEQITVLLLASASSSTRGGESLEVPQSSFGSHIGMLISEPTHSTRKLVFRLDGTTGCSQSLMLSQSRRRLLSDRFLDSLMKNCIRTNF